MHYAHFRKFRRFAYLGVDLASVSRANAISPYKLGRRQKIYEAHVRFPSATCKIRATKREREREREQRVKVSRKIRARQSNARARATRDKSPGQTSRFGANKTSKNRTPAHFALAADLRNSQSCFSSFRPVYVLGIKFSLSARKSKPAFSFACRWRSGISLLVVQMGGEMCNLAFYAAD